jgi:NAD-dependent histone deacetylase SIR2
MDSENTANRVPSVSPIPTTLKRKRVPSISGDPPSGKPVLKQSKDASADALADLDELEEVDDEEYDSDSSGNKDSIISSSSPLSSTNTSQASLILPDDEDATQLRARLREIGPPAFEKECLETKQMDLRVVGTMLGVPRELAGHDDEEYLGFFRGMMLYITSKRAKLEHINTIDDAASLIKTRSKILVITGAGISTSLGIPDFRSKDTGFYAKLKEMGMAEPEEVFDIFNFDYDPQYAAPPSHPLNHPEPTPIHSHN